jgi:hypothetical protein
MRNRSIAFHHPLHCLLNQFSGIANTQLLDGKAPSASRGLCGDSQYSSLDQ